MDPTFAFTFLQFAEKLPDLIDGVTMSGDEIVASEDDVEFAGIRRPLLHIKKRDMDREENALIVLEHLGLIRRRDELFQDNRVDIEILVQITDVVFRRRLEINPREVFVCQRAHVCVGL